MKALVLLLCCLPLLYADLETHKQYCALKRHDIMRACAIENRAGFAVETFRNCAVQVKFHQTLDELTEYVCKDTNSQEFMKFAACMDPPLEAENQTNPNFLDILQKCIRKAEKFQ
uniref:TxLP4 n=1 Tax=Lychas mucronatus TaxID=172552 RepID=A0A0U1SNB4_LYCMC|nr:TxLP4 [Lychas mucronatus]